MLTISSFALFQVGMIIDLDPCSRFNTALLGVHMARGLGLYSRFNTALLSVLMVRVLEPNYATDSLQFFSGASWYVLTVTSIIISIILCSSE